MANKGFPHQDDGGEVTVFSSDKQLLFACTKGHYWVVDATSVGKVTPRDENGDSHLTRLRDTFGDAPIRLMRITEH